MAALPIAVWGRIEPHAHTTDLDAGLAAEIADPLWLLLRQYQLGELTGDDAGSPVAVELQVSWSRFTRYRPEGRRSSIGDPPPLPPEGLPLPAGGPPLEALVEGEPTFRLADPGGDPRDRPWGAALRAGRALSRALAPRFPEVAAALAADPRTRFTPPPAAGVEGDAERRYRALFAEASGARAVDGVAVLALLDGAGLPPELAGAADPQALDAVLTGWRQQTEQLWGVSRVADPMPPAWVGDRLEYAFAVAAPALPPRSAAPWPAAGAEADVVLRAQEYDGTGIEWYSLDLAPGESLGAAPDAGLDAGLDALDAEPGGDPLAGSPAPLDDARRVRGRRVATLVPAPLTYPGMPASRFWELEDRAVALGRAGAGPTDLVKMLALDFATVYGPDWFLAPVEVPVGSVSRVDWVVVRDTFGVATLVGTGQRPADGGGLQFQPSRIGPAAGPERDALLVVLPAATAALSSPPREDVALQRDELANLAWSIEQTVLGPAGRGIGQPWSRREFDSPPVTAAGYDALWRLATPVARPWTPLVPVELPGGARVLRAGRLEDTVSGASRGAAGLVLADLVVDPEDPVAAGRRADLREEEVTRAGIRVQILEQSARGTDGRVFAWRGRSKRPWRGEASSGLRYDATTEPGHEPG